MTNPTITTIYGLGADGVWYTSPVAWVPGTPPAPVVVPPIVIPPVVTPPAGAVVMPKVTAHYPVAATLAPPGTTPATVGGNRIYRLGKGAYSGTITMGSGSQLYGMGGQLSDCSGLLINIPDGVTGVIISGLFGAKINCNGSVKANTFRRLKWCDINVQSGTFESNLIYGFEAALNINNAVWKNNRVIAQTRHGQADPSQYDTTIKSPAGRASVNNVLLWRTFQSLPKAMLVQGQGDLTIVGLDVEQSPTIMEASDNGVIRTAVLNGGGNSNSGFGVGADELQIMGGNFGASPTVIANGLKRLYSTGINFTLSGSAGSITTELSPPAQIAPFVNPVRTGSPWERPSLLVPPNPTIVPGSDATAIVQAAVNGSGFLPAGIYNISRPILMKKEQVLIGAGDGQTVINCKDRTQDAFQVSGGGTTCAFHISDLTIIGARYGIYANTAGDQLNSCTLSHITFRNCTAGLCAQNVYGVDNNFFDGLNFVSCGTGVLQLPDPAYTTGETPTMTYIDKTVFYACQFIKCASAADMQAKRANNLDAFLCCVFTDCLRVGTFRGNNALLFAQCDMINSGVLDADLCYVVSPYLSGTTIKGNAIDPTKTPQLLFGSVMA